VAVIAVGRYPLAEERPLLVRAVRWIEEPSTSPLLSFLSRDMALPAAGSLRAGCGAGAWGRRVGGDRGDLWGGIARERRVR